MENKKKEYKKSGLPTINEMIDIELSEPNINITPNTIKQFQQWHNSLMKKIDKLFQRQSKYMTDNNQTTDGLLIFLSKYPELFATEYGTINRDMIKWALAENIKKNRELIDKIQEIETSLNLEIHHKW